MLRFLYFSFLLFPTLLFGGDTPCGATPVPNNMNAPMIFSNAGNSDSGIPAPPYGNYSGSDFWISFTFPANGEAFISVVGTGLVNPAVAVYEPPCLEPKLLYDVVDNNCDGSDHPFMHLTELNPGQTYLLRIWSEVGANGPFEVFVTDENSPVAEFDVFADAFIDGDCITLTTNSNTQNGCAWYQIPIDFTMPFTHSMSASFGNNNSGADGICLVYQSNGPNYCGASGGGIGALGMPNSAIFEFDTWENGNYNDPPVVDHSAFNINGDMDHLNSINGPVSLPNIEDGQFHTIEFSWNPVGNAYSLSFDGSVLYSGSYDIINNCFGGSSTAFYGFTSGTGAASNLHQICPDIQVPEYGTQSYEEVTICEGESYNGYTEDGFYVDFGPVNGNCVHQNNYQINVLPVSDPFQIDTIMCQGNVMVINGQNFTSAGFYQIPTVAANGCDSTIILYLETATVDAGIIDLGVLDCEETPIALASQTITNIPYINANFLWVGGGDIYNDSLILITEPGLYTLTIEYDFGGGIVCTAITSITIDPPPGAPDFTGPTDQSINCEEDPIAIFSINDFDPNYDIEWTFNGNVVGNEDSLQVNTQGTYYVEVIDPNTNCSSIDSATLSFAGSIPEVTLEADTITCFQTSTTINVSNDQPEYTYVWIFDGDTISTETEPMVNEIGVYTVYIIDTVGCVGSESIEVLADANIPFENVPDSIIACSETTVFIEYPTTYTTTWFFNGDSIDFGDEITLDSSGIYTVEFLDSINQCSYVDTFEIEFLGPDPMVDLPTETLTCDNPEFWLFTQNLNSQDSYEWYQDQTPLGNSDSILIDNSGTYILEVTTPNGCSSADSVEIMVDFTTPTISLTADTLDCVANSSDITATITDGSLYSWSGPNNYSSSDQNISVESEGWYIVNVENAISGCISVDSIYVFKSDQFPTVSLMGDTLDCVNNEVDINASVSNGSIVGWTGPSNFNSSDQDITVMESGWYIVSLVNSSSNCTAIDSIFISDLSKNIDVSLSDDTLSCATQQVVLDASILSNYDNITWTGPNNFSSSEINPMISDTGVYELTIFAPGNCTLDTSLTIYGDYASPFYESEYTDINCNDPQAQINITTNQNNTIQIIDPNDDIFETDNLMTDVAGEYTIVVTGENGCTTTNVFEITEDLEAPDISITSPDSLTCDNLDAAINSDSQNAIEYSWSGPNNFTSNQENVIVQTAGIYNVVVTGENGCTNESSTEILEFTTSSQISITGNDLTCTVVEAQLSVASNDPLQSITWSAENNETYNESEWIVLDPGVYSVTVINEYGCSTEGLYIVDEFIDNPIVTIIGDTEIELALNGTYQISTDIDGVPPYSYQWLPQIGLSCYDCQNPIITTPYDTTYTVLITDANGCQSSATITIRTQDLPDVYIPNIISGTSLDNQYFTAFGNERIVKIKEMYIFDRWGNKVFDKKDFPHNIPQEGWNGTYREQDVAQGVYVYLIVLELDSGAEESYKGTITVIR